MYAARKNLVQVTSCAVSTRPAGRPARRAGRRAGRAEEPRPRWWVSQPASLTRFRPQQESGERCGPGLRTGSGTRRGRLPPARRAGGWTIAGRPRARPAGPRRGLAGRQVSPDFVARAPGRRRPRGPRDAGGAAGTAARRPGPERALPRRAGPRPRPALRVPRGSRKPSHRPRARPARPAGGCRPPAPGPPPGGRKKSRREGLTRDLCVL